MSRKKTQLKERYE